MKGRDVLFSHKSDNYITPKWLFEELDNEFHFKMDCATTILNPLGTPYFITEKEDGLKMPWMNPTFCNPPYSEASLWVEKAYNEWRERVITFVMLLPARTDTRWFHDYIYKKLGVEIRFIKGRLKFEGTKYPAPFPSMLVIFR